MIKYNLIDSSLTQNFTTKYFAHYKSLDKAKITYSSEYFSYKFVDNLEELSKNDWELHKKYIEEGVNTSEIAKIIRNDEIEKLQEISSQEKFNFDQSIEPSLYEICSFINQQNVSLIDYAAFFGSIKCFKYLLHNNATMITAKYAIAGGNLEIIKLCLPKTKSIKDAFKSSIRFHQMMCFIIFMKMKLRN